MQHWQVYIEWNEKLSSGWQDTRGTRSDKDPSVLVRRESDSSFRMKLKTCGVFGVSSDEVRRTNHNRVGRKGRGDTGIHERLRTEIELPALAEVPSKRLLTKRASHQPQVTSNRIISGSGMGDKASMRSTLLGMGPYSSGSVNDSLGISQPK
jgi:hypothetical protein